MFCYLLKKILLKSFITAVLLVDLNTQPGIHIVRHVKKRENQATLKKLA